MPEYLIMTNFWTLGNTTMETIEAKALKNLENIVIKLFIVKIHTNLYFDQYCCENSLFLGRIHIQVFRQQKNQPLPIQRSSPSVYSQERKTTKKFQFSRWLFQKIPFLYFFLHKSWIWQTLGHVMNIFLTGIFLMLQRNTFGPKQISKVPFWQFFNFSKMALLNRCMKFKIFFDQKYSFEAL